MWTPWSLHSPFNTSSKYSTMVHWRPWLVSALLILSTALFVPVQGYIPHPAGNNFAVFGACYDPQSNALTCNFNKTFCEDIRRCVVAGAPGEPCRQMGPVLEWKTPLELAGMSPPISCTCEKTHVGSCYTVQTDHVATCHLHNDHCPANTIWLASGYRFGCVCVRVCIWKIRSSGTYLAPDTTHTHVHAHT